VGKGFAGTPAPPASMLYPFRGVGLACMLIGAILFALLPSRPPHARSLSVEEGLALVLGVVSFAVPLFAVGGSAQALTRAPLLTALCWTITAIGLHVLAAPLRTAPDPLLAAGASAEVRVPVNTLFLREGLVLLLMALGPLVFLIWATMILWNR
jgi:preprotein translocase subunit SecG